MKKIRRIAGEQARIAALVVVVSCAGPAPERKTLDLESDPPPTARFGESVAHAANPDATLKDAGPRMPSNPSRIALRFSKVQEMILQTLAGQPFPYPHEIVQDEASTTLIIYLEQGVPLDMVVTAMDEEGRPLGEPTRFTIEPNAKIGTADVTMNASHSILSFAPGAQAELQLGDTYLEGPATDEFMDTCVRKIFQGVYTPKQDGIYQVEWTGNGEVYSFLDGPPQRQTEPFPVSLKAGQQLGLYPVASDGGGAGSIILRELPSSCGQEQE